MTVYDLTKPEGREAMRADRQSELDAIEQGIWPRNVNDVMRWSPSRNVDWAEWAAKMCKADLAYLATLPEIID